jgi:hypothetical protein
MSAKTYLRSFAGGEITPELYGRLDLTKNQTGLARCLNFIVLPHGPIANRAGFPFVIETKDSSKRSVLVPFIYSTTQAYVLEFGDQYMRVHSQGGTVLEAAKNITGITSPAGVITSAGHGFSNGDWVYLTGIGGTTELNGRFVVVSDAAANTFRAKDQAGNYITTGSYGAYTSGGTAARVYEISTPYLEADLASLEFTQSADVLTITHINYQQRQLSRVAATNWSLATFTVVPTIGTPAAPTVVATVAVGADTDYYYQTTAIASDGLEESLASATSTVVSNKLSTAGNYNTITPDAVSGAVRYNVYKKISGIFGYIGQTDGTAFIDDNITPDLTQTPPLANDPFPSATNYPGTVGYFKGRRWFAGTSAKSQNLWGTRSGTESNLTYSIPTRDDDSISVRLTALQNNRILHIVPLGDLLLLTSGAEWRITTKNSDTITPQTIDYVVQSYNGSSSVKPVVTSDAVLYAQAQGGRIREMKYSWETTSYKSNDISIMAPHLFDGYTITSMTYAHAPFKAMWATRSDGKLLGLTYVPEHEVQAWHQHNTQGEFESVCAVPENGENVLYAVIKRTINGRTVRYIEYMHSRQFRRLQDAFFVDCGATLNNAIAAALTPGTGATAAGTEDVIFTAGSAVFASTDVDRYIHYDYTEIDDEGETLYKRASALITAYTDSMHVKATVQAAWPSLTAIASGGWRMTVTTVTGLWHLEGEEVAVLADGAVYPTATVENGAIDIEEPASVVHVGLSYNADAKTLPLAVEAQAFGQGGMKNVNRLALRVSASSGVFAGPAFDKLKEAKQRTDEVYGTPPNPVTGILNIMLTPSWSYDAPICIRQSNPLPLTITALVPDTAYAG